MNKINWERKVKYVLNDEGSDAGQALLEALYSLPASNTYSGWLYVLAKVEASEKSLGDYIRGVYE